LRPSPLRSAAIAADIVRRARLLQIDTLEACDGQRADRQITQWTDEARVPSRQECPSPLPSLSSPSSPPSVGWSWSGVGLIITWQSSPTCDGNERRRSAGQKNEATGRQRRPSLPFTSQSERGREREREREDLSSSVSSWPPTSPRSLPQIWVRREKRLG